MAIVTNLPTPIKPDVVAQAVQPRCALCGKPYMAHHTHDLRCPGSTTTYLPITQSLMFGGGNDAA